MSVVNLRAVIRMENVNATMDLHEIKIIKHAGVWMDDILLLMEYVVNLYS